MQNLGILIEPEAYAEYRESWNTVYTEFSVTMLFKNEGHLQESYQISIMERFVQNPL